MSGEHIELGPEQSLNRRSVLTGAGKAAAAAAAVGATLSTSALAADSVVGQYCMTIVYENGPDVRFDFDYYENTHMPLIMRLYGDSISRFELRRGQPGADGSPPPFIATLNIYIADVDAFEAAAAEHQAGIRADVSKFTNANLIAQRDSVFAIDE
ncbi:EthD family reductase [Candidatus Rariloculus sp.]|uniref:EthD family reductase n=1 Tax=Candidatus Rariloculus sp. TaxID=3101265 RepID=UPI003D0D0B96